MLKQQQEEIKNKFLKGEKIKRDINETESEDIISGDKNPIGTYLRFSEDGIKDNILSENSQYEIVWVSLRVLQLEHLNFLSGIHNRKRNIFR